MTPLKTAAEPVAVFLFRKTFQDLFCEEKRYSIIEEI
jgi:hypothetical protein